MHDIVSCAWGVRKAFAALSVGVILGLAPAHAQLADHQRIESLFTRLESRPGSAPLPPSNLPPANAAVLPPAPVAGPAALRDEEGDIPGVPFAEVSIDRQNCPGNIKGFRRAVQNITEGVQEDEQQVFEMSERFDALRDASLEAAIQGTDRCSAGDRREYAELLAKLQDLDIESRLGTADNLMGCAQQAVTGTKRQMDAIREDASAEDQQRRLNLSGRLIQLSSLDGDVTQATRNLGSLELKRKRLERGTVDFENACEVLDDFSDQIIYE